MREAGEHMRRKKLALFAFPEGTRSHMVLPELLPFKKGVFHLAIQTQIPIVPVVCENYHRLYASKKRFEAGEFRVAVLPPISTEGMTENETDKLIKMVRDVMFEQLVEFDRQNDAQDVESTLHPSRGTGFELRGLVGLASRIVGDGSKQQRKRTLALIQREREEARAKAQNGTQPGDYGLVSAAASQARAS